MLDMDEWREVFQKQVRKAKPGDVWNLSSKKHLDVHNLESGWKKAVQEHAHASFMCSRCYRTWSSHHVVILFHMYWEPSTWQGWVKMRFFRQACYKCSPTQNEMPMFAREDMKRVIQHLILDIREKCYRERVCHGELLEVVCEGRGPHRSEFCEACQMGFHKRHNGKPDGAVHHGKPGGAARHGKPGRAVRHGKPETALHPESSQSPGYFWNPTLSSYKVLPVHSSERGHPCQLPSNCRASVAPCPCSVGCIAIAFVIFMVVAYWMGWL